MAYERVKVDAKRISLLCGMTITGRDGNVGVRCDRCIIDRRPPSA